MPPLTAKVPGNGTGTLGYTLPGSGLDVESIYVDVDATGAGGAVTAELTITDQSGVVIARKVQNTTIDAGIAGSATWALQLDDDCLPGVSGTFAQTVLTIAAPNTLRGYWRLGETAAPMADSSGWSGGPNPLITSGAGAAPTYHITGALPFGQDDGAISLNGAAATGLYLVAASAAINTGINSAWTIAAWLNPTASVNSWIACVYNNLSNPGPGDSGWQMSARWTGTGVVAGVRRAEAGAYIAVGAAIPTGAWTFVVATYDAATLKLYTNGLLAGSFPDARADLFNPYLNPTVGRAFSDPLFAPGTFLGGLDEVAVWGATLTIAQIQELYAASLV